MPEFSCRVATTAGEVFEKSYVSTDEGSLRRELETQDLLLLDVRRRNPILREILKTLRLRRGVSSQDFLFFNQELRALIRAGLPIVPSLDILLERRKNKTFRGALIEIRDRVKSGESLSEAFGAQGDMFPKLYASSLASGERSGELASVLERYIAYMRNVLAVRRKVVSALIYPVVLLILMVGLMALLIFFIIPKFETFLSEFGVELPLLTQVILDLSLFCRTHWLPIVAVVAGSVFGLLWWNRTENGRLALDTFQLKLPLVGAVFHNYAQNRFTRTLGTLQSGGIPLVTSLELSARAVGNALFERKLLAVAGSVREGEALWESLDKMGLLSDMTIQMVKVGESTGAMDEMLDNASEFTDEEIDSQLTRLMALVEPIMLVFMAGVVAILLLSIYYPMIQVYGQATA